MLPRLWLTALAIVVLLSVIIAPIAIPGATLPRRVDALGIAQVWVPAGCFKMGSDPDKDPKAQPDEEPAQNVCITKGYWLDQYDVTNAAFDAFVKAGGYNTDAYWSADELRWKQSYNIIGPVTNCTQYSSAPQQPRGCVNYYEAEAYANWRTKTNHDGLLYRLPTAAEWEYAARGPLDWIYPWGNRFDSGRADTAEGNVGQTSSVGSYPTGASWIGAQDMAGNVEQWVEDWYGGSLSQNDPTGPSSGDYRVLRGGSWYADQSNVRSAAHDHASPGIWSVSFGFRVVGVVPSP